MEFRTAIKNIQGFGEISHSDSLFLIGSCFSDNIGARLKKSLMQAEVNPFGTVYNPASILSEIERIISGNTISKDELFTHNGLWHHFGFHSKFSSSTPENALQSMNQSLATAHEALKSCNIVIITLGTAFVYESKAINAIVSNCHKIPAKEFNRFLLSFSQIKDTLTLIIEKTGNFAPQANIIFTVSPIRHIGDGLEQNQLSKSLLRAAVGEIVTTHNNCSYFPAYEIMMDDLRDYRFYAADMIHPSDIAVDYIWDSFKNTFFNDTTKQLVTRCEKVFKRIEHRPITNNIEEIAKFRNETAKILDSLVAEYPYIGSVLRQYNM